MLSKPVAFVLLGLACITAAAGGAYVATRHNLSDAAATVARDTRNQGSAALTAPLDGASSPKPVAETEAVVSRKAEDGTADAGKAEEGKPEGAKPEAAEASTARPEPAKPVAARPESHKPEAGKAPVSAGTPVAEAPPAPRQAPRTVPLPSTGAPVIPADPPPPAAALPAVAPAPAQAKPFEPSKPADDTPVERAPQLEELVVPAAAVIGLQVETSVSSERARLEDRVDARVSRDVMASGRVAIPAGSRVIGSVTTVERGGKLKDQARLGIRFHTLVLADGTQVALHTDPVYRFGEEPSAASSKKIGGAAIGGAILGAILGGGKGAAIGGAAGAGAGSAAVMAGDRSPASLRPGEYLNVKLSSPTTITIEKRQE